MTLSMLFDFIAILAGLFLGSCIALLMIALTIRAAVDAYDRRRRHRRWP